MADINATATDVKRGNRIRSYSDATTATFPIKKIIINEEQAQQKQPQRPHQQEAKKTARQQQDQRRKQEPIDPAKIEEAKKAAIQAAKLASRGAIVSENSSLANGNTTTNINFPPFPPILHPAPIKKLKWRKGTKLKKHVTIHDEQIIGHSVDDDTLGKNNYLQSPQDQLKYHNRQLEPTFEEEKREEGDGDENISTSFTFGTRTETTARSMTTSTSKDEMNPSPTGGKTSAPSSKKFFVKPPKSLVRPEANEKKDVSMIREITPSEQHKIALRLQQQRELEQARTLLRSAWTCGVCGTPFRSLRDAERHELLCLVMWVKRDRSLLQDAKLKQYRHFDTAPINEKRNYIPYNQHFQQTRMQQSISHHPSFPPVTGGEIVLPSPSLRKYISMTDDAAVKIARKARRVLFGLCRQELFSFSSQNKLNYSTLRSSVASAHSATTCPEFTSHDGTKPTSNSESKSSLLLLYRELDAQRELALLSRDRQYYSMLQQHSMGGQRGSPSCQYNYYYYYQYSRMGILGDIWSDITDEDADQATLPARVWRNVKHKFEHAYELVKEGPESQSDEDRYKERQEGNGKRGKGRGTSNGAETTHNRNILYVNVVVKNSVQVVNNELQRIARGWWESTTAETGAQEREGSDSKDNKAIDFEFEWIRAQTQKRVIQLAGLALASDFTPRKVAVQLSNDLFRLMGPQLELRGVSIHTEIEYRVGPYFVLAVNVLDIDWMVFMEHTHDMVLKQRRQRAKDERIRKANNAVSGSERNDDAAKKKKEKSVKQRIFQIRQIFPSWNEIVAQLLAFMHRLHFLVALPLLHISYFFPPIKYLVNKFILAVVTDDIFRYVEKKGMEMQLEIKSTSQQASFMLAALRELRQGDKKRKKKKGTIDSTEDEDYKPILGPLLGPAIKDDKKDAKVPSGVTLPESLEFVGLEVDLPVGFQRFRWAFLNSKSYFFKDAFLNDALKYDKITLERWSSNEDQIGLPSLLDDSFLNATREYSYLMPKSAFVKANMCYATLQIIHYDEYCFVIKEKTLTPEVPYGNTFIAWTQYSVINTGNDTCRMICSVEAEFPNGPPMVARQIKSGMRSGTAEKFVQLGETICRYADAFP
mmetsp:Transcript_16627/g.33676  ORF Transcript_16627/g.33676 Transcript_16627/m.33676 type:complete len:1100 (+) Transcript_16627:209-3508(+)